MQKNVLALAISSAITTPALVQAHSLTIYGTAGVAGEVLDNDVDSSEEISNNHSAIGFKGLLDVNPTLRGIFHLDAFVGLDNSNGAGGGDSLIGGGRDGYVGLQSDTWGTVALGFQGRPYKTATNSLDLFEGTLADYTSIMGTTNGGVAFDTGNPDSVIWFGPNIAGLSWHAQAGSGENEFGNDTTDFGAQVNYSGGPLYAAFDFDRIDDTDSGTFIDPTDVYKLAGSYSLDATGTTLEAIVEQTQGDNVNSRFAYYVGASQKIQNLVLKVAFAQPGDDDATDDSGADYLALGADYYFTDEFKVYAIYARISNDANGQYQFVQDGSTSSNSLAGAPGQGVTGADSDFFGIGMRYDFSFTFVPGTGVLGTILPGDDE